MFSLQLLRQTGRVEHSKKGDAARSFFHRLSRQSKQNFESKYLILEAEIMHNAGRDAEALQLYEDAMRSAREHKLIHESAIISELSGMFYYEIGLEEKACSLLKHSVDCYKKWGALAVANRVETSIRQLFGSDVYQLQQANYKIISANDPHESSTKKRRDIE